MYVVEEIEIYVRPMFIQNPRGVALHSILIQDTMLIQNSRGIALHSIFTRTLCSYRTPAGVTLHSTRSAPIQDSPGAALYSILIQDSRSIALHSTFILEVLRDATLEAEGGACPQLRLTRASMQVYYSLLKTDHISVFKNQQRRTPPPSSPVSCPLKGERLTNCVYVWPSTDTCVTLFLWIIITGTLAFSPTSQPAIVCCCCAD